MSILLFLSVIVILMVAMLYNYKSPKPQPQEEKPKPQQRKLTWEEREAMQQALDAFDWKTYNAIVEGTYNGPLPKQIGGGHYTSIYPDLYNTRIAGINFRRGIKNLAEMYFDALLVPDPKNKFDKNAIKIVHAEDGRHLGFIPSDETDDVREWCGNQFPYQCRAHIDEFEDWDEDKERDVIKLKGIINIQRNKQQNQ